MSPLTPLELLLTIWTLLASLIFAGGYSLGRSSPARVSAEAEPPAPEGEDFGHDEAEPDWPEVPDWDTGILLAMRREQRDERHAKLASDAPHLVAMSDRLRERLALAVERAEWAGAWRAGQDRARVELFPAPPAPAAMAIPGLSLITTPVRQLSTEGLEFAGLPLDDARAWWDGQAAAVGEGASNGVL